MALYFIGLGLNDEKDISIKGLEIIKRCEYVYLETYTSRLVNFDIEKLKKFYGKDIIIADRNLVESKPEDTILDAAQISDVAFLVVGDPFGATTHIDLRLRAKELGVEVEVIHNASIMNAIGVIGLELYKYGKTTSIPFNNNKVTAPFDVVKQNDKHGLHTLILLDLDLIEEKFMKIEEALRYLIKIGLDKNRLVIGCGAIGSKEPEIKVGSAEGLLKLPFEKFPQCIVIPGKLHFIEEEALRLWY